MKYVFSYSLNISRLFLFHSLSIWWASLWLGTRSYILERLFKFPMLIVVNYSSMPIRTTIDLFSIRVKLLS